MAKGVDGGDLTLDKEVAAARTRAEKETKRVKVLEVDDYSRVALSFPYAERYRLYDLRNRLDGNLLGYAASFRKVRKSAEPSEYIAVRIGRQDTIELLQYGTKVFVAYCGQVFADMEGFPSEDKSGTDWTLRLDAMPWGSLHAPSRIRDYGLTAYRTKDSLQIPLRLGRRDSPKDFLRCIWRIVTLGFLYLPPVPNHDVAVKDSIARKLSAMEHRYVFAITLFLRMVLYPLDYIGVS